MDVAPETIELPTVTLRADTPPTIEDQLSLAQLAWAKHDHARALELFDAVWQGAPNSTLAPWAAFWAASVAEEARQFSAAAERFAAVHERFPQHELARQASVCSVRLWIFVGDAARARALARSLLGDSSAYSPQERIALHSAVALGALESDELNEAQRHVLLGRQLAERYKLTEADVWSRDLAQLHFALGELRAREAAALTFVPPPSDFAERFEARAQAVLDAQSAYLDVMRARDAFWTARAGLRIGELYQALHREVMDTPIPPLVPAQQRALFSGAMRVRFVVLLEKGLAILDRTLAMAERTGEVGPTVESARQRRAEISAALDAERQAIEALPISRADVDQVLREINARQ